MMGIGAMGGISGFSGLGMLFGSLLWVGLIALVAWALVSLIPRAQHRPSGTYQPAALDVLKERYARGEVGSAEYEQMKRDLS